MKNKNIFSNMLDEKLKEISLTYYIKINIKEHKNDSFLINKGDITATANISSRLTKRILKHTFDINEQMVKFCNEDDLSGIFYEEIINAIEESDIDDVSEKYSNNIDLEWN